MNCAFRERLLVFFLERNLLCQVWKINGERNIYISRIFLIFLPILLFIVVNMIFSREAEIIPETSRIIIFSLFRVRSNQNPSNSCWKIYFSFQTIYETILLFILFRYFSRWWRASFTDGAIQTSRRRLRVQSSQTGCKIIFTVGEGRGGIRLNTLIIN